MTATTTSPLTLADVHAIFTNQLAERESRLQMELCCLTLTPFVIGFGPNQYCAINEQEGNVVKTVKFAFLESATRFSREDAEALTRNCNIRDGNGAVARPIGIVQAMEAEIAELQENIALLDAKAAQEGR